MRRQPAGFCRDLACRRAPARGSLRAVGLAVNGTIAVDPRACVRCAACSIVAPTVFAVDRRGSRVRRQPDGEPERAACRAAQLLCPTQAITG